MQNIAQRLFILVFLILFVIIDLEVSEFIRILGCGNNTEPISQVVFLQVLLCQILQIPLAKGYSGSKDHLVLFTAKSHVLAKVSQLATNLNTFVEVCFEITTIHDTVFNGVAAVDGELQCCLLAFANTDGDKTGLAFQRLLAWLLFASLNGGSFLCWYFSSHGQPFLSSLRFSQKKTSRPFPVMMRVIIVDLKLEDFFAYLPH